MTDSRNVEPSVATSVGNTVKKIERLGILGGTFNPIHNGHMSMARGFAECLGLDRLLLIPVWSPPHKSARAMLPASIRIDLCRLACQNDGRITVSDIEIERGGTSYTADTLRELAQMYPDARLYLITGADMFRTLDGWKNFNEISRLAELCACSRHEGELAELRAYAKRLEENHGARCHIEDFSVVEVSSTQVRELLQIGGSVSGLLPPQVLDYIKLHKLYMSA